jgi:hypothetical protein
MRRGEFLTAIALREYGNKAFWIYIYEENKDHIFNPDNIPVGTMIRIPPATKYGIDAGDPASVDRAQEKVLRMQEILYKWNKSKLRY